MTHTPHRPKNYSEPHAAAAEAPATSFLPATRTQRELDHVREELATIRPDWPRCPMELPVCVRIDAEGAVINCRLAYQLRENCLFFSCGEYGHLIFCERLEQPRLPC